MLGADVEFYEHHNKRPVQEAFAKLGHERAPS